MSDRIDRNTINTLITGYFADPFSVLGMHKTTTGLEVHALLPDAAGVWVIEPKTGRKLARLECPDLREFLNGIIPRRKNSFRYQLAVVWHGQQNLIDDPYRFGPLIQEMDAWLLSEGTHLCLYETLGAHAGTMDGVTGTCSSVWASSVRRVSVVGQFNYWDGRCHPMRLRKENEIWELFIPGAHNGQLYKYEMIDANGNLRLEPDPYILEAQMCPETTFLICGLPGKVMQTEERKKANQSDAPISIYEVHPGSWCCHTDNNFWLSHRELTDQLVPYAKWMGFTHLELLPINEHPLDGSWGYQPTGPYVSTRRFGTRDDFRYFIDAAHAAGPDVILGWVPGHFSTDDLTLAEFDGTSLYEHSDPREGYHQDWNTLIYNYGRREVSNFLVGNAFYWIERSGIDTLRADAVASMIYRDYSRREGEWTPSEFGGRENLEVIESLRNTNRILGEQVPGAVTVAEESIDFPGVPRPQDMGSLDFWYKWNLGWMHDILDYMKFDPIYRQYHRDKLTFGTFYSYTENFVLPLSYDEVVHGKKSILDRMPGDAWQKFANLCAYHGWMWAFPGKKLLFMGNESAQGYEWNHGASLDWRLLGGGGNWHHGVQHLVCDLNCTYHHHKAAHELDFDPYGFEWLVVGDRERSVLIFVRRDKEGNEIIVTSDSTPVSRHDYRFDISQPGKWCEILNTGSMYYHGSNAGNGDAAHSDGTVSHGCQYSPSLTLPLLTTIWLVREVG